MIYQRTILQLIRECLNSFPIVTLLGARQSGKTTLLKEEFPSYEYVSLEAPDVRELALNDPKHFISLYSRNVIIDEVQRVPTLLSYLQTHVDNVNESGMYILTGSHNFMLSELISETLSGRTAVLTLAPLSISEMKNASILDENINTVLYKGSYPRVYKMKQNPSLFYSSYITTYIERDVKMIKNITSIGAFEKFLHLLAGRCSGLLNTSDLSSECGVSRSTIEGWISVLEESYIVFRLQPYFRNASKRFVKKSKLYFYDTGLVAYLLGISSSKEIENFYMKGALFENLIVSEFVKDRMFNAKNTHLSFYRDSNEVEVDIVEESAMATKLYEVKSSSTMSEEYFRNLNKVASYFDIPLENTYVIFRGDTLSASKLHGGYISYRDL